MAEEKSKAPQKNVGMAVLCYLGILVIIPLLTEAKNDPFVKYHIKQGLVLLIAEVILSVATQIPFIGWFLIGPIGGIIVFILAIIGIVNVVNGEQKPLPLLGQYADRISL